MEVAIATVFGTGLLIAVILFFDSDFVKALLEESEQQRKFIKKPRPEL